MSRKSATYIFEIKYKQIVNVKLPHEQITIKSKKNLHVFII